MESGAALQLLEMSNRKEEGKIKAPNTYQEWLHCFDVLKQNAVNVRDMLDAIALGHFTGTDQTCSALQKQVVETVNAILDKSAKRFVKELNDCIVFNDFTEIEIIFRRLKRDVNGKAMFFDKMLFLPRSFRDELGQSVKTQMQMFWDETVTFLQRQSLECSNSELDDAVYLLKRIHLFEV